MLMLSVVQQMFLAILNKHFGDTGYRQKCKSECWNISLRIYWLCIMQTLLDLYNSRTRFSLLIKLSTKTQNYPMRVFHLRCPILILPSTTFNPWDLDNILKSTNSCLNLWPKLNNVANNVKLSIIIVIIRTMEKKWWEMGFREFCWGLLSSKECHHTSGLS